MKKFGFTLAEILITLGIIGVVAALTTPALVKSTGSAQIGPSLAKFVNTIENACQQLMHDENLTMVKTTDIPKLYNYIIMAPKKNYSLKTYDGSSTISFDSESDSEKAYNEAHNNFITKCPNGSHVSDECRELGAADMNAYLRYFFTKGTFIWQLKDGSVMVVKNANKDRINIGPFKGVIAEVFYDIDGDNGDNRAGRDVYAFLLDRAGILIPVGSIAHKTVKQVGAQYITTYEAECDLDSTNFDSNMACTGKIADNNYKAD